MHETKFFPPRFQNVDGNGDVIIGSLVFYQTGTTTKITTYSDYDRTTPNTNPINADSNGRFGPIFFNPDDLETGVRVDYYDDVDGPPGDGGSGNLIYSDDRYSFTAPIAWTDISALVTQERIGDVLNPRMQAETDAGIAAYDAGNSEGDITDPEHGGRLIFDVRRYGAVDGQDSTDALRAAAKAAREQGDYTQGTCGTVYAPAGEVYLISGNVDFRCVRLEFYAEIDSGSSNATVFLGGYASIRPNPDQYLFKCNGDTVSESVADVEIRGAKGQTITVEESGTIKLSAYGGYRADNSEGAYPDVGTAFPAEWDSRSGRVTDYQDFYQFDYSIAYSHFHFGTFTNLILESGDAFNHPDGTAKTIVAGDNTYTTAGGATSGWINENKFYLKDLKVFRILNDDAKFTYRHNNNVFYGGFADVSSGEMDFQTGKDNHWHDVRAESIANDAIKFGSRSERNQIGILYDSSMSAYPSAIRTVDDMGKNNLVYSEDEVGYQWHPVLTIDAETCQMDDDAVPTKYGIFGLGVTDEFDDTQTATLLRSSGEFSVAAADWFYASHYIPVSPDQASLLAANLQGVGSGDGFRPIIKLFDADKNPVRPSGYIDTTISELEWAVSSTGGGDIYYLRLTGGGDTRIGALADIAAVYLEGDKADQGSSVAALADHEWYVDGTAANGDNVGAGGDFQTLYFRDASGAPNSSSNDVAYEHEKGNPIVSVTIADEAVITTLYPHGIAVGDSINLQDMTATFAEMSGNEARATAVTTKTVTVNWSTSNWDSYTSGTGYLYVSDLQVPGGGSGLSERMSGITPLFVSNVDRMLAHVVRRGAYYAKVYLRAGFSSTQTFDSLTVAVRNPVGNRGTASGGLQGDRADDMVPDHNPQLVHAWS